MKIVFLYKRLYDKSKKQLEALNEGNLILVEKLTKEREDLTDEICRIIDCGEVDFNNNIVSKKAHELTEAILTVDEQIKNRLINELISKRRKHTELKILD